MGQKLHIQPIPAVVKVSFLCICLLYTRVVFCWRLKKISIATLFPAIHFPSRFIRIPPGKRLWKNKKTTQFVNKRPQHRPFPLSPRRRTVISSLPRERRFAEKNRLLLCIYRGSPFRNHTLILFYGEYFTHLDCLNLIVVDLSRKLEWVNV